MNWGQILAWTGVAQSAAAAVGYAFAGDWRKSLYFFFAACITSTVAWR